RRGQSCLRPHSPGPSLASAAPRRVCIAGRLPAMSAAAPRIRAQLRAMARIVQKFGGTSVATIERIRNAARRVKREVDSGNEVAVVVSAMSGVTDQLVAWTREVCKLHDAREYDTVVASGEQV